MTQNCVEVWMLPQESKHRLGRVISLLQGPGRHTAVEKKGGEETHRQPWRRQVKKVSEDTHQGGPAQHAIPRDHFDGHLEKWAGEGASI